jgi:beta-glucosidase
MTFRRGASLTTAATLGYADSADIGPTAGNGFDTRWNDDLALLQEIGITDVRLTLDWARLQPKPGSTLDVDWVERFEQILHATDAIGLRTWACLHDGSIPRWFDNDGGLGDDEALTRWWPRWVERAADRFGDLVHGWVPFSCIPAGAPAQPWIDTWGILGDGRPPVVAAIDLRQRFATIERHLGRMDHLGAVLTTDWEHDGHVGDAELASAAQRWGDEIRDAADLVDGALVVCGFDPGHDDADVAADIVAALRTTLDDAIADGVEIDIAFIEPAIAGPESMPGLLDVHRAATPSSDAYLDGAPEA